ncbi:MAG: hypothetical protein MUC87_18665 [Bacteroidia bacterium]|jgi:hypothetical protein|nr:hypothetical protein [Bacteroidia bacterium]
MPRSKKINLHSLLTAAFVSITLFAFAQKPEAFIPADAVAVFRINQGPVAGSKQLQDELRNELFTSGSSVWEMPDYTQGLSSLNRAQTDSVLNFLYTAASQPAALGLSTTDPMYVYHDMNDTLSFWAYAFTLDNRQTFLNWSSAHLFADSAKTAQRGNFTYMHKGRVTVACNGSVAWLLLADYEYRHSLITESKKSLRMLVDSMAKADSLLRANLYIAEKAESEYNAVEEEFQKMLSANNYRLGDSIYQAVAKNREKRQKKGEIFKTSFQDDLDSMMKPMRRKLQEERIPKELLLDDSTLQAIKNRRNNQYNNYYSEPYNYPNNYEEQYPDPLADTTFTEQNDSSATWKEYTYNDSYFLFPDTRYDSLGDSFVTNNLLKYLDEITRKPLVSGIANEPHFKEAASGNSDVTFIYNMGKKIVFGWKNQIDLYSSMYPYYEYGTPNNDSLIANRLRKLAAIEAIFAQSMWAGSGMAGTASLRNNYLQIQQNYFFNPSAASLTKGLLAGKVNKSLLRYIKSGPVSITAISFDPKKLAMFGGRVYDDYIAVLNMMLDNQYASYYTGILTLYRMVATQDLIPNLLGGDMVFAITDFVPRTISYETYEYDDNYQYKPVTRQETIVIPEYVFAASLGNETRINEIIGTAVRAGWLTPYHSGYIISSGSSNWDINYLTISNGNLIITNDSILATNYFKKGYPKHISLSRGEKKQLRKSPLAGWWDAERTRLIMSRRGDYNSGNAGQRSQQGKHINRMTFAGKRGPGGSPMVVVNAFTNDEATPGYGYLNMLRIMRLIYSLKKEY